MGEGYTTLSSSISVNGSVNYILFLLNGLRCSLPHKQLICFAVNVFVWMCSCGLCAAVVSFAERWSLCRPHSLSVTQLLLIAGVEKMLYWMPQPRVHKGVGFTLNRYWLTPASRSGTFHNQAYWNYSLTSERQQDSSLLQGLSVTCTAVRAQIQIWGTRCKYIGPTNSNAISDLA